MDQQVATDIDTALELMNGHSWIAIALLFVGAAVRVMKDDRAVRWCRIEIAPRYRVWAALALGMLLGILHKLVLGGTWGEAMVGGFVAGGGSTWLHELVVESIRKGRDIGMSKADAPPPPPPAPPISIKPPAGVVITDSGPPTLRLRGDVLFGWIGLALAIAIEASFIYAGIVLTNCKSLPPAVDEGAVLTVNAGECRRKALATIAKGGTCELKRARLDELMKYDAACVGLYADAGPIFHCRDCTDGGTE